MLLSVDANSITMNDLCVTPVNPVAAITEGAALELMQSPRLDD